MVRVTGTRGNIVNVQVFGIASTMARLKAANISVSKGADFGVVRAGTFVEEEVKDSVMGDRAEPKSVDTGHFVEDVKFDKMGKAAGQVHAPTTPYADFLEFGTSRIDARSHFRNTEKRSFGKVKDIIAKEIKFI